jgi:3-phosphoshikimate 1-carboxyvinyltransferase
MQITRIPSFISGTITIPASKSYMQRACAAALLKGGKTILSNYGISKDDKAALAVIQQLGANFFIEKNELVIESKFNPSFTNATVLAINLGESGLGLRMFTPIVALLHTPVEMTGQGSLTKRPMHFFDAIFPQLQVAFQSNNGYLPFTIQGPIVPKDITIDGSLSSQFLTGLLMAYSYANTHATITVNNLSSKPYIDISLAVLKSFGLNVPVHKNYKEFVFTPKTILPNDTLRYAIESDWSSASFLLVAAAINGDVLFKGLQMDSVQADKKILEAMTLANVQYAVHGNNIQVQKSPLTAFQFDATDCPDLFPPLVALAANAVGNSIIKGVLRLEHKESNRGITLQKEFAKLGVEIILQDDEMIIYGKGAITVVDKYCDSHNDHRIAMALAVAILSGNQSILIDQAQAIEKSYPQFFEDLDTLYSKENIL